MAKIERYDRIMGHRAYLLAIENGQQHWVDRFLAGEFADETAEKIALEISMEWNKREYVIEVLY